MADAAPGSLEQGLQTAKDGTWFTEVSSLWPGTGLALQVDEVMFKGRSDFQVRWRRRDHMPEMHAAAAAAASAAAASPARCLLPSLSRTWRW